MTAEFRILLGDLKESHCDPPGEPPEDDPDDIDMYLWRFCYEKNRRIFVQVDADELSAELDPDIRIMLLNLPRMVRDLENGEKDWLSFSEIGTSVSFLPDGDTLWCGVERGGEGSKRPPVACKRDQVINELWRFLERLTQEAIDGGYLSVVQAKEFLGHDLPRGP